MRSQNIESGLNKQSKAIKNAKGDLYGCQFLVNPEHYNLESKTPGGFLNKL
jgi:hypothetical protein